MCNPQIQFLSNKLKTFGKTVEALKNLEEPKSESLFMTYWDPLNADKITPITELFSACRSELSERTIKPALARGNFVVCDRFYDSTYVCKGLDAL